ncbi:1510_t:CDS:10 [Paraglomus occultum]|uniref:1510_t:CDS:1 n=1 Tax=Paraglomus occultum TaxID=144539 RepID=A0A9N8WD58_9GLOM|nr:1510_t:CDS:10 [Paraglomus occultum]
MVGVHEILKKRILDTIGSVQPAGRWKVVVVDARTQKVISSACKMFDILEGNVTLVESLEKSRQPYPTLEAVYILTPSYEVITKVIEDFAKHKTPLYAAAHLFFTSGLDEKLYQRLKTSPASNYIRKCTEIYIDFHAIEAQVYSFDSPESFFKLYSPEEAFGYEDEIRQIAKKLVSVCVTLGENPLIRYQRSLEADHPTKTLSYKLAMLVQSELDQYVRDYPEFGMQENPRPRGVLFICDRSLDMNAPFLHEFTYQAMVNDLLPLENGQKYSYAFTGPDGSSQTKEANLDESDQIWVEIRHKHMKDCIEKLMKDFNDFVGENAGFADKDKAASLNDMKRMLANLPQFQNMKEKFSVHLGMAQESMSLFDKQKLASIANIEQANGHHPKAIVEDMVPLLDDPVVSSYNKVRMLLLYMMYKNGIIEEDRRKLLAHARISYDENDAINNTLLFGVKLIRSPLGSDKSKKSKQKVNNEGAYDISRYVPQLKIHLENHIKGTLDVTQFPYARDPSGDGESRGRAVPVQPVSLRSTRAEWYKRGAPSETRASRLIVFVAGGVTYSELRSAYELSEKHNKDVIIGSTHIITPTKFVDDLKLLRRPPRPSASVQPPTLAPPLPQRPPNSAPTPYSNQPPVSSAYGASPKSFSGLPSQQGYGASGYANHGGTGGAYGGYQGNHNQQYPPPANASFGHVQKPSAGSSYKPKTKLGKELGKVFKF